MLYSDAIPDARSLTGTVRDTDAGADGCADPGADCCADPGADGRAAPGADGGTAPGTDGGSDPVTFPGLRRRDDDLSAQNV